MSTSSTNSARKASSNHLNRQLGLYSLAAAAAGVSMLALAQPAAGEVVITRKTIPIPLSPIGMSDLVKISMANNGVDDFSFWLYNDPTISDRGLNVYGGASPLNGVLAGVISTRRTWHWRAALRSVLPLISAITPNSSRPVKPVPPADISVGFGVGISKTTISASAS